MILNLIIAAALSISAAPAPDRTPPCRYEDGSGQGGRCVWDAKHMGNGGGRSLLILNGGDDDARYIFITHRRAHRLMTTNR